jgi:cell division initiation protein
MNDSGTPHLLTDVRFSVARKGYDPDEVDNFLERVSAAVAQLQEKLRHATAAQEAAETRAADAIRNESRLQSRIAELEASGGAPVVVPVTTVDATADAEAASGVLVMAQRTADATINDARTRAAQLIAEAEAESTRIVGGAHARADEATLELERRRRELVADNEALEAFVAEQRSQLAASVSRIQNVLDDPAALRVAPSPVATPVETPDPAPAEPVRTEPAPSPVSVSTPPPAAADGGSDTQAVPSTGDDILDAVDDDDADAAMRRFFDADFDDDRR